MIIIDATDLILGRMAAKAAKAALNGEEVSIINCEKAVVVGSKDNVMRTYIRKSTMGVSGKGPHLSRGADRLIRRTIRGMIPYKTVKGAEAFRRTMCYLSVPNEFEGKKTETFKEFNVRNTDNIKFVTLKEISEQLGFSFKYMK
jgi:large subunit ribosomal protein L13